jgi:hypothetical protein
LRSIREGKGAGADSGRIDNTDRHSQIAAMKINQLKALLEAAPFVPFALVLPDGERLRVPHSDFAWIHPGGRSVVVALKGDVIRIVNWQMVTSIETKAAAA